jgi:hypothetical protein
LIQIHNANTKLFLSVFSLLLLVIVICTPAIFQKGLAATGTNIVAAGDWGCSDNTGKTVQNVVNSNPKLLLALGDFSYDKTSTCWFGVMKPLDSITKINIGNHDVDSDILLNSYLTHFGLSKQYYSFDINNIHVLTLSTEEKFKPNSDQYHFVVNDLQNAANNPDIKWIVANMHTPFYSSPNECNAAGCEGNENYRDAFHPLFDKYGVDLVLQGHVHNYQRSLPIKFNQEDSANPIVTSTLKTDYNNPDGAIFAIVGTGGESQHALSGKAPFMAFQQDSKFGILNMHFSDNKMDSKFVSNDGTTLDHFSIIKTAKKKVIERISDNIVPDTKTQAISYKDQSKTKPVIEKDQNGKPAITFKDENAAVTTQKTEPQTQELKVQEDKPAVTFKDENAAVTTDKTQPKIDELKVQEDKPAMTTKLSNEPNSEPPKDHQSMLVSKEKIEQADSINNNNNNNKPTMVTQLGNDPPTDDKPISQSSQDKSDSSEQGKSTNDNAPNGNFGQQIVNTGHTGNNEFVDAVTDTDTGSNINTNDNDPFSPLK